MASKRDSRLQNATYLFGYLLVVWGFYRIMFQFPEVYEELLIKPVIWLGGTYYFWKKERGSLDDLGITWKNLFPSIYFALSLAAFFGLEGLIVNYIKHGGLAFNANIGTDAFFAGLLLTFMSAVSEEVAFRGYIFNRLYTSLPGEWIPNIITSIGWTLVHLPVVIFVWQVPNDQLMVFALLSFVFSMGAGFVYARTKNVFSSILLNVFWQWPIILFR